MRRREILASALTVTATVVSGCGAVDLRPEHTNPTVLTDDNPRDDAKYLEFSGANGELATVGVNPTGSPVPETLATSISHPEYVELESLTQRFAIPDSDGPPPQLSLQGPFMGDLGGPHPAVSLFRDRTATVLEVHRFGELADETVFIVLPVAEWPESARRLVVESTVAVDGVGLTGRTHLLEGQLQFEFPTESSTDERGTDTPSSSG